MKIMGTHQTVIEIEVDRNELLRGLRAEICSELGVDRSVHLHEGMLAIKNRGSSAPSYLYKALKDNEQKVLIALCTLEEAIHDLYLKRTRS